MNDHVNVEDAVGLQILDLEAKNRTTSDWHACHGVVTEIRLKSEWANLVHYRGLDAHFRGYLRLKIRLMQ